MLSHFIFEQARNKVRSKVSIHKMYTDVLLSTFTASKLAPVCFGKCLLNCYILKITRTPRYIDKEHLVKIETVTGASCFFIGSPYQLKQILQIKPQARFLDSNTGRTTVKLPMEKKNNHKSVDLNVGVYEIGLPHMVAPWIAVTTGVFARGHDKKDI